MFRVQPEWIHHTAWKGKGDVYHIIFDTTLVSAGASRECVPCRRLILTSPWQDKCQCWRRYLYGGEEARFVMLDGAQYAMRACLC